MINDGRKTEICRAMVDVGCPDFETLSRMMLREISEANSKGSDSSPVAAARTILGNYGLLEQVDPEELAEITRPLIRTEIEVLSMAEHSFPDEGIQPDGFRT